MKIGVKKVFQLVGIVFFLFFIYTLYFWTRENGLENINLNGLFFVFVRGLIFLVISLVFIFNNFKRFEDLFLSKAFLISFGTLIVISAIQRGLFEDEDGFLKLLHLIKYGFVIIWLFSFRLYLLKGEQSPKLGLIVKGSMVIFIPLYIFFLF